MGRNNQRHTLPPRPPPGRGSDSYRPSSGYHDAPPPPPPFSPPPPPPPPPPGVAAKNSYSSQDSARYQRPPQGDFTFRVDMPSAIQEAREYDRYRPGEGRRARINNRGDRERDFRDLRDRGGGDRDRDVRRAPNPRKWNPPPRASDRKLLKTHHEGTVLDFAEEGEGVTYRSFDDLSDSVEADMDISDGEVDGGFATGTVGTVGTAGTAGSKRVPDNQDGPAPKRARLSQSSKATDGQNSVPQWSNPDPYTVIPPPDESRRHRDMVQLIRKARVNGSLDSKGSVKEQSDFIAFDEVPSVNSKSYIDFSAPSGDEQCAPEGSLSARPPNPSIDGLSLSTTNTLPFPPPPTNVGNSRQTAINLNPLPPLLANDGNTRQTAIDLTPSDDFGSRKRTHDDEIKPLPPLPPAKPPKRKNNMTPDGKVLSEWRVPMGEMKIEDRCPWLKDHSESPVPVLFTKEVTDLYRYMKATPHEHQVRQDIIHRLDQFFSNRYTGSELKSFGSFQNGLYLPTGDMDLALISRGVIHGDHRVFNKGQCWNVGRALENSGIAHAQTIQVIAKAKVPLTKFVDAKTGLNVDISYDKLDGVKAIQTFVEWNREYPIMEPLVLIIKHFLAMRGLNEPVNGGIGGFSVICLVVSMLQHDASTQARQPGQLGELLMKFFRLYGMEFNFRDVAILTRPSRLVNKRDLNFPYKNPDRISIIDPNNADNDISGGSSNTANIVKAFRQAYNTLAQRLDDLGSDISRQVSHTKPISVLACIFEGDYLRWKDQRARLELIYQQDKGTYGYAARRPIASNVATQRDKNGSRNSRSNPNVPTSSSNQGGSNQSARQDQNVQGNRSNATGARGGWGGRGNRGSRRGGGGHQQNTDSSKQRPKRDQHW